jgi:hypothetical protein
MIELRAYTPPGNRIGIHLIQESHGREKAMGESWIAAS